jgi:glycosyltransferase involved in cell wall biosynthesis
MKRAYRIVMVAACPYPTTQGTQVYIRGLCRALVASGHEVHLVTYHFGEDHLAPCGATIHRTAALRGYSKLRSGPGWGKPLLDLLLLQKLRKVIRAVQPDLIHAHNYEAQLVACLARRGAAVPVVYSAHNLMSDELESYFEGPISRRFARAVAGFLDRELPRRADRCVTLCEAAVPALAALGMEPSRIHPILPGLHADEFPAAPRKPSGGVSGLRVVYAGNPDSYQDLQLLFSAMASVCRHLPSARLRLVSSAGLGPTVELAQRCGLDSRFIEPFVEQRWTNVASLVGACDVAALPRRLCRGFPIKLMNYRALGLPVVACAGAAEGVRHGEDGLVVPFDVDAYADALVSLLRDPELAVRMGQTARSETLREHRWERRVLDFERVYSVTLEAHSSLRRGTESGRCSR